MLSKEDFDAYIRETGTEHYRPILTQEEKDYRSQPGVYINDGRDTLVAEIALALKCPKDFYKVGDVFGKGVDGYQVCRALLHKGTEFLSQVEFVKFTENKHDAVNWPEMYKLVRVTQPDRVSSS